MIRLFIIRHGQTEWNRVERFRGLTDLELNDTGVKQAEAAAARLREWTVASIYASPLKRAMRTAEAIARPRNMEVHPLQSIIDMNFGKWHGLSLDEARQQYPELYTLWEIQPHKVQFPDGENLPQVQARAMAAVKALIDRHHSDAIAMVSHRVICKLLVLGLLGLDSSHFWQIEQNVAAINHFVIRDGLPIAITINETCHLKGL